MIKHIQIEAFQGLRSVSAPLGMLTVVHGPNESGKTSLAQALDFCADTTESKGTVRFGSLREVVNQNASLCRVAFEVDGDPSHVFMRTQPREGSGERRVDGLPHRVGDYAGMLEETIGVSAKVFTAALRSGALLDEKPGALLELLLAISGTTIGANDIAAELVPQLEAIARLKLRVPGSLDGLAKTAAAAVEHRKEAKRALKSAEDALTRCPIVPEAIRGSALMVLTEPKEQNARNLRQLQLRRDAALRTQAADAGAKEERRKATLARIAELEAVPEDVEPSRTGRKEALAAEKAAALAVVAAQKALTDTTVASAGDRTPPDGADTIDSDLQFAINECERLTEAASASLVQADRLLRTADALAKTGDKAVCDTCGQPVSEEYGWAIRLLSDEAKATYAADADALAICREEVEQYKEVANDIFRIRARIAAYESLPSLDKALTAAREAHAAAQTESAALNAQFDRWQEWQHAQEALNVQRLILGDLDKPAPAPVGESVADLDAAITRTEQVAAAVEHLTREDALRSAAEAARRAIGDADTVAQACGPDSAQARLVARATHPFFEAANKALATIVEGYSVRLDTSDGPRLLACRGNVTLGADALSKGRRQTVLYVLQVAVAMLTKAPIVVFDDPENLDEESRGLLTKLAMRCNAAGVQVLILTCASAPQWSPPGVTMYRLEAGEIERVPEGAPPF